MTLYPTFSSRKKPIWLVDYSLMGKQIRKSFPRNPDLPKEKDPGYIAAEKFKKSQTQKIFNEGPTMASMSGPERVALLALYAKIKELGLSIQQAQERLIQGSSLATEKPSVAAVIVTCLLSKQSRIGVGITQRYYNEFSSVMREFSAAFQNVSIDKLTGVQIDAWVNSRPKLGAMTRKNRLRDAKTLMSFALKSGIIEKNPCTSIQPIIVPRKTPGILSPRQVAKLMRVVYNRDRRMCAWFALQLFCGIRAEEMDRLTKDCVILSKNMVHISEEVSKTTRSRNIEIPENAREWLKIDGDYAEVRRGGKGGRGQPKLQGVRNLKKRFNQLRRQAGLLKHWPNRAMRHSSVSYLYALTDDANYVTKQHGHGVGVMLTHYRATRTPRKEIVTKELAQEYFGIKPPCHIRVLENVA